MERALSAPGKLFLSGEYAVLWGGVARVAAVGPRANAHVRSRTDNQVELLLEGGKLSAPMTPAGAGWGREVPPEFHFVAWAVDFVLRAAGRAGPGLSIAFAPSPGAPDGRKLGLGSSARAAVLAVEAARYALNLPLDTLKLSLLAHSLAQGGKGSGGDVAAIYGGNIVAYRRYDLTALSKAAQSNELLGALHRSPAVDLWKLPRCEFPLVYAFAGESSSTRFMISEVEKNWGPADRQRFVTRSDGLGDQLEWGLTKNDFAAVREAVEGLESLLASLGEVETEGTRRILALAKTWGCAGKISGAGGGDGCILIAPDLEARDRLLESLNSRGLYAFTLELQPGLRGEATADPVLTSWFS